MPKHTFEAYHEDKLFAWGDAAGIHYAEGYDALSVVAVLHSQGRAVLNGHVPPADDVGIVLREGQRYSGAR